MGILFLFRAIAFFITFITIKDNRHIIIPADSKDLLHRKSVTRQMQ